MSNVDDRVSELLEGAVETHMHSGPGAFPRQDTDFEAARKAADHGMRAICLKNHHFETASRAQLVSEETGFTVVGGITLNSWVGGLNPQAVDGVAKFGGTVVWMPTITAKQHLENADISMFSDEELGQSGITVLSEDGSLTADAIAVLERVAANGLTLGLSHLGPHEAIPFAERAVEEGVEQIIVQHPFQPFMRYTHDQMQTMADLGATLEFHWICTTEFAGATVTVDDFVEAIDTVGVDHCVIASDGGATDNPPAIDMLKSFIAALLEAGMSESELEPMITDNPARVLQLE